MHGSRTNEYKGAARLGLGIGLIAASAALVAKLFPAAGVLGVLAAVVTSGLSVQMWFAHTVQRRLDDVDRFSAELASCNLTTTLTQVHPHPLSAVMRALAQIQVNLRAVVSDARDEVNGTALSLAEIAQGTHDLSARTETQASALQQTAASMEELAGTVKQTAANAAVAAMESDAMAKAAAQSGHAVDALGGTIQAIEHTSLRVTEIVKIIESIAFKTNVLALNAAIESARAGDAGRGFAVVAAEVRSLAQSCASSAKEIREVVIASATEVADGARQMGAANQTICRTKDAVDRVGNLIEKITVATLEQTMGLGQINEAVAELDRATQSNAALVEQTAAVTEALNRRTETLKRSVQIYRI